MARTISWTQRFLPRSLAFRIIAFSTIWAFATLVLITTVISTLFRDASERGFESLLSAHLFNLISSVEVDDRGALTGSPNLGDLRFLRAGSGWYWSVEPGSPNVTGQLSSLSLTQPVAALPTSEVPFDASYQRRYWTDGIEGEKIEVIESEFLLDGENRVARFRMMGNRTELEAEIDTFERRLYTYLGLFGFGMIAINAVAILLGLEPLGRVSRALADIRQGTARRLDGDFPSEIAPLAEETNALIESNRRVVERARTQVGNLAHSLKTPLAVMLNEGRAISDQRGRLIVEQAGLMQQQVEHYLQRARMAAQRETIVFRTPVAPLMERMARVIRKLAAGRDVTLDMPGQELTFAGEAEDLEEIVGNLLENATKWSRERIGISVAPIAVDDPAQPMFEIVIEDDGPGIPEDLRREALQRGRRLDETKPGTGLGLSIVADMVREYGGRLELANSPLGGLAVRVALRRTLT